MAGLFGLGGDEYRKAAAWARTSPANGILNSLLAQPNELRRDEEGNLVRYSDYGKHNSEYGWEIDHVHPTALGGPDEIHNLRALSCRANRSHGGLLAQAIRNYSANR